MKKKTAPLSGVSEKLAGLSLAQKALLFIFTFALIGAGFYYGVYEGQQTELNNLKKNIAAQETRLVALKAAAAKVDVLQAELAKSEEEFKQLLTLLPDQKEIPGLLESVSQLGSKVGLENILFQPQPERPFEFYSVIPIRLDLVGTFNELGVFLDSVSKLHRILKVESLTLTRQKDKGSQRVQVGCTVVTYRFVDRPAGSGAPGEKGAPGGKAAPPGKAAAPAKKGK